MVINPIVHTALDLLALVHWNLHLVQILNLLLGSYWETLLRPPTFLWGLFPFCGVEKNVRVGAVFEVNSTRNQWFSNVLRVHKTGPRANPGTWIQKWPKQNLFKISTTENRTQDIAISIQSDYPTEPKCSNTWTYVLWVGIYTLEVSSLSKMYCRPDSSSGIDLWT